MSSHPQGLLPTLSFSYSLSHGEKLRRNVLSTVKVGVGLMQRAGGGAGRGEKVSSRASWTAPWPWRAVTGVLVEEMPQKPSYSSRSSETSTCLPTKTLPILSSTCETILT